MSIEVSNNLFSNESINSISRYENFYNSYDEKKAKNQDDIKKSQIICINSINNNNNNININNNINNLISISERNDNKSEFSLSSLPLLENNGNINTLNSKIKRKSKINSILLLIIILLICVVCILLLLIFSKIDSNGEYVLDKIDDAKIIKKEAWEGYEKKKGAYYYAYSFYSTMCSKVKALIKLPDLIYTKDKRNPYISLGILGINGGMNIGIINI